MISDQSVSRKQDRPVSRDVPISQVKSGQPFVEAPIIVASRTLLLVATVIRPPVQTAHSEKT